MKIRAHKLIVVFIAIQTALVFDVGRTPAATGDLDLAFGTGGRLIFAPTTSGYDFVRRVRIQPDGKIVTFGGGSVTSYSPSFLTRHYPDGTPEIGFGVNGQIHTPSDFGQYFNDFVVAANGNLIVTGNMPNEFVNVATGFITYDTHGRRVFPPASSSWDDAPGRRLLVQNDGKLVVIAGYGSPNWETVNLAAMRYSSDGAWFDETFGNRSLANTNIPFFGIFEYWSNYGSEFIGDAVIQPDGKILMAGYGSYGLKLVRLNSNGTIDTEFGLHGIASFDTNTFISNCNHPAGIALQSDGKIVMNGVSAEFGLYSSFILRFNQNGVLDSSFGANGLISIPEPDPISRGIGASLAIQSNGKIITAGERNRGFAMMRFNPNGDVDTTFGTNGLLTTQMGTGSRAGILSLAWQSDGKLVAAGSVQDSSGRYVVGLARYQNLADSTPTVAVSGRVMAPGGSGLRNAVVSLTDSNGGTRTAVTSTFGYYQFDGISMDATYTITVSSKRYRFTSRNIQITESLANMDFAGIE